MSDNQDVQNAEEQRSYCEGIVNQTDEYIDQVESLSPELAEDLRSLRDSGCEVIDNAANVEVAGTTVGELVTGPVGGFVSDVASGEDITEAAIDNFAGDAIDEFLEKYANYSGTLLDVGYSQSIPVYPPINATVGFSAKAEASLESKREGATVTCTGSASASGSLSLGLSIGFTVCGKGVNLFANLENQLNFSSGVSVSLGASGATLTGSVSPLEIDLTLNVNLNIGVNGVPEEAIQWVGSQLGKETSGNAIVFPLGSIALLIIKTPSYSASFNIAKGKFTTSSEGEYKAELHPKLKAAIESAYKTATNLGQAILDGLVEGIGDFFEGAAEVVENVGEAIQDGAEAIGRAAVETGEYIAEKAEQVGEAIEEVADRAAEAIEDFSEAAQEAYTEVTENLSEAYDDAREFVGGVAENISEGLEDAGETIAEVGGIIADAASDIGDTISDAGAAIYDTVANSSLNPANWSLPW